MTADPPPPPMENLCTTLIIDMRRMSGRSMVLPDSYTDYFSDDGGSSIFIRDGPDIRHQFSIRPDIRLFSDIIINNAFWLGDCFDQHLHQGLTGYPDFLISSVRQNISAYSRYFLLFLKSNFHLVLAMHIFCIFFVFKKKIQPVILQISGISLIFIRSPSPKQNNRLGRYQNQGEVFHKNH